MAREPTGLWLGFGERGQRIGLCPNTYFDSAAARSGPSCGGAEEGSPRAFRNASVPSCRPSQKVRALRRGQFSPGSGEGQSR